MLKASGLKNGPRCRDGIVPGYNQLIGLAVGEKKAGLTFATTISYEEEGFVSLNREVFRAFRYSHTILKGRKLRFACDRGFDDKKTFAFVVDLDHDRPYWLLVSYVPAIRQKWILLTNVPITSVKQAKEIWFNYRRRWCVEKIFRFLKRDGLRWEDFKVLPLEAIRRLVNLVLIAALFLLNARHYLDEPSVQFLLVLGGKLGLKSERDGPYLLLRGMQKFLLCLNTLALLKRYRLLNALLQTLNAP